MRRKRLSLVLGIALIITLTISGCAGIRRAFSPAGTKWDEAMAAWNAKRPVDAVLLMAEASEMDPNLVDPKIFFNDHFDTAVEMVKSRLRNTEGKADYLFQEQKYNAYVNLQKMYQAVSKLALPLVDGEINWSPEIIDYSDEIEAARVASWNAFFDHAVSKMENENDTAEANRAINYALDKFQTQGSDEYSNAVEAIIGAYITYASARHLETDIDVLESVLLAYETVLEFDPNNQAAVDGIAEVSVTIADLYVMRGREKEASAAGKSGKDYLNALESAADDYDRALYWNPDNNAAAQLKEGLSPKVAEYYYQEGVALEQSQGVDAKDRIIELYETAQKWVAGFKDTDKRIFNVLVSAELQRLSDNIGISRDEIGKLRSRFQTISDKTGSVIGMVNTMIDVADMLIKTNSSMKTAAMVLKPMKPIPYVGSFLGGTGTFLEKSREAIIEKPANKMSDLKKKVMVPLKTKLEKFKGVIDKIIGKFNEVDETLAYTDTYVRNIKDCVERKGDKVIYDLVEENTKKINVEYEKFNKMLIDTNNNIDGVARSFENMMDMGSLLNPVRNGLNKFKPIVDKAAKYGKKVDDVLSKKITVDYLIDSFTFSVKDILNGISGVIDYVQDLLMEGAMKLLRPLLGELEIKLPEIPGLDQLTQEIDKLKDYYDQVEGRIEDVQKKVDQFMGLEDQIKGMLLDTMKAAACN